MEESSSAFITSSNEVDLVDQLSTFDTSMEACFKAFDKDSDGSLTLSDFNSLCRALFRNDQGKAYNVDEKMLQEMFDVFDVNQDGYIDVKEFQFCWQRWIKPIVRPTSALIIVDVQNDFISGTLALSNCPARQVGEEVVEPINKLLETIPFDAVFYSLDWHPDNHVSFIENVGLRKMHATSKVRASEAVAYDTVIFEGPPINEQQLWPKHCVQNSWGAQLHPKLKVLESGLFVYKGIHPDIDSYSAFWDNNKMSQTTLAEQLQQRKIHDLYVCGIAYDVCVGATAKHGIEHGYRTILIDDACRGISLENIQQTRAHLAQKNALVVHSSQVKAMVEGRDRRPELGYFSAIRLREEARNGIPLWEPVSPISPRDQVIFLA